VGDVGADNHGVTYNVVWSIQAARARRRLRDLDPTGAALLTTAITALADNPKPATASPLGGSGWYYLRLGQFRAVYEIRHDHGVVYIGNVGQLPRR
jgi:mRNA interferase RelE/StbE